ncbi:hypothetical protein GQ457_11G022310 [Hibiscus cannabinus]
MSLDDVVSVVELGLELFCKSQSKLYVELNVRSKYSKIDEHSKVEIEGENNEIVEVDEAQKPLTAYFNFYISECKKRGGKKKITNVVRKELGRKWGGNE